MDNLTHTLIGLAAGEAVARGAGVRPGGLAGPVRRTTLLVMGMAGGNLPDVDLLWSMQFATGDRLDYLVEHRGYTHTLVGCAVLALLLFLGAMATLRWRGHRLRAPDFRLFGAMALVAVMLHLGMDALNVYGVHPFWPWNNRWYYGDSLFIIEPLCWLAMAPLYFSLRTRAARACLGIALFAGCMAVLVFHRFGAAWWALPLVTLLLLLAGSRLRPLAASAVAVFLLCGVLGTFRVARATAADRIEHLAAGQFPAAVTLDLVLSPAPAHPLCWDVMLLQREGMDYIARLGQLHLGSQTGEACARSLIGAGTAPLRAMNRPVVSGMSWKGEYTMDIPTLARLANSNCDTRKLASFVRAPFAARSDRGWLIGDLRFDRETGPGFAELLIDPQMQTDCRSAIPWTAPRRDLGFP